ncbi:MAG: hypothetical protein MJ048_01690, partial [Acidaminococcaceae bacterium]|nr:hypothetical protein [Acidaminococcaceae bacterium]
KVDKQTVYVNLEGKYWVVKISDAEKFRMEFNSNNRMQVRDEVIEICKQFAPCDICAYLNDEEYELYLCESKDKKPEFKRTIPDRII